MPALSVLWMKEKVSDGVWLRMALGFAGAALVMKPGFGVFAPAAAVAQASGFFGGVAHVGIRDLTRTEPVLRRLLYFSAVATAVSAVPLLWSWRTPSAGNWPCRGRASRVPSRSSS